MRNPSEFDQVFIHRDPVDMRRGINGLCDIVHASAMGDVTSSRNLFVFRGKRRHLLKVLYFDLSGFCLWQKRLEADLFPWPKEGDQKVIMLTTEQLSWLLKGIDPWKLRPFPERKFDRVG